MKAHLSTLALLAGCLLSIATSPAPPDWEDYADAESADIVLAPGESVLMTLRAGATPDVFPWVTVQAGAWSLEGQRIEVTVSGADLEPLTQQGAGATDEGASNEWVGVDLAGAFDACEVFDDAGLCWIELDVEVTARGDEPATIRYLGSIRGERWEHAEADERIEVELVPFE